MTKESLNELKTIMSEQQKQLSNIEDKLLNIRIFNKQCKQLNNYSSSFSSKTEEYKKEFKEITKQSDKQVTGFFGFLNERLNVLNINSLDEVLYNFENISKLTDDECEKNKLQIQFIQELFGTYHLTNIIILFKIIKERSKNVNINIEELKDDQVATSNFFKEL